MARNDAPQRRHWIHTGRDVGAAPYPFPESDESVQIGVAIPTSDGITLRGDLYVPQGAGPFPAVVEITPYGSQTLAKYGNIYAARGYLFLAVDCRGRYRSEGEWEPLSFDRRDGHDVLSWIARHTHCNGRVGTRGHSYSGYNQLLAASDAPACLQAMVVGVAPGDPFTNTPFQGGCYDLNDLCWLLDMTGRVTSDLVERGEQHDESADHGDAARRDEDRDDDDDEYDELFQAALDRRPFRDVDLRLGLYHRTFRDWTQHWQLDAYWHERSALPGMPRTAVPTLHISGWWDGNGRGSTQFFQAMRQQAKTEAARENQRLLMGPWDHDLRAPDCSALPAAERRLIERGALHDALNDELAWFDQYLKDLPRSAGCRARVTLFLTGTNQWVDFDDWPVSGSRETPFYLCGSTKQAALLPEPPQHAQCARYTLDPLDPTPFAAAEVDAEKMPFDQAPMQRERDDLLLFDTPEFTTPFCAVGMVRARLYAAAATRDFDLVASLYDVHPDGRSIFLTDGVLRARFRKGYDRPELVEPGEVNELEIDLWHIGHVFRTGHRLRLQLASAAHLRFDLNPCTGGELATDTASIATTVQVFQGPQHPSCLYVYRVEL